MFQVVLNHDWFWANTDQKIWYFSPCRTVEDAETQAQSMLTRGVAKLDEIGVACILQKSKE